MRVKRFLFVTVALLAIGAGVSGCGFFGDRSKNRPPELKYPALSCMKNFGHDVKTWAEGGQAEIGDVVDCLVTGADKFIERARGVDQDSWGVEEIGSFLEQSLELPGSAARVRDALVIKRAVLGGQEGRVSRDEIRRAREFLLRLKPELKKLGPSLRVLSFNAKVDPSTEAQVSHGVGQIERLASMLSEEFVKSGTDRSAIEMVQFVDSVKNLGVAGSAAESWIPLVVAAKAVLAGGESTEIQAHEWPRAVNAASRLWIFLVRTRYELNGDLLGERLPILTELIRMALAEVDASVRAQSKNLSGSFIAKRKILTLIQAVADKNLLPGGLSVETAQGLLTPVLTKVLHGNWKIGKELAEMGLSLSHVQTLRSAVEGWLEAQRLIVGSKDQRESVNLKKSLVRDPSRNQMKALLSRGHRLMHDGEGRLWISRKENLPRDVELSRSDLDGINLTRFVIALLMRGYTHDEGLIKNKLGLTVDEIQELYLDMRRLGIDLGFIDMRNTGAGARTFMEASLFTSVADGDSLVSLHEAVEWFKVAFSGSRVASQVFSVFSEGGASGVLDYQGRPTLDINFFRARFALDFERIIANLPGMVKWLRSGGDGRVKEAMNALETAGRATGASDQPLDMSDIRALFPILHYTENIFVANDKDGNDVLDEKEIWAYFPVVQPYIRKLGAGKAESEFWQKAIFAWLLTYGEPPQTSWLGGAKLASFGSLNSMWNKRVSRMDILKVMASFAQVNRLERMSKIQQFVARALDLRAKLAARDPQTSIQIASLFQCQRSESSDFALSEVLQQNADQIAPDPKKVDAVLFAQRIKAILMNDQRFTRICLPF